MNARTAAACLLLATCMFGCRTADTGGNALPVGDITVIGPGWNPTPLPQSTPRQRVNVTLGSKAYSAEYGGEPSTSGDWGQPSIVGMGDTWQQSRGYYYLWGYWRLIESERIDAITWGTTVVWRLKNGVEQLFVECGQVMVMPKGVETCVLVKEGYYVDITEDFSGMVTVSAPKATPQPQDNPVDPVLKEIKEFLDKARLGHADPCNP